jgi:hypothetical protein
MRFVQVGMVGLIAWGVLAALPWATPVRRPEPCAAPLPPLRLFSPDAPDSAVVCRLFVALKAWIGGLPPTPPDFEPGDSGRIVSLNVGKYRIHQVTAPADEDSTPGRVIREYWQTQIEADVPGRPRYFVAALDEAADTISFGVVHR